MTNIFLYFPGLRLPVLVGNGCHHHPGVVVRWWSPLLPARAHPLNHSAVAVWRAALSPRQPLSLSAVVVWRAALSPGQPLRVPPAVAVGWCPSSIELKRNFCFLHFREKFIFVFVKITHYNKKLHF